MFDRTWQLSLGSVIRWPLQGNRCSFRGHRRAVSRHALHCGRSRPTSHRRHPSSGGLRRLRSAKPTKAPVFMCFPQIRIRAVWPGSSWEGSPRRSRVQWHRFMLPSNPPSADVDDATGESAEPARNGPVAVDVHLPQSARGVMRQSSQLQRHPSADSQRALHHHLERDDPVLLAQGHRGFQTRMVCRAAVHAPRDGLQPAAG